MKNNGNFENSNYLMENSQAQQPKSEQLRQHPSDHMTFNNISDEDSSFLMSAHRASYRPEQDRLSSMTTSQLYSQSNAATPAANQRHKNSRQTGDQSGTPVRFGHIQQEQRGKTTHSLGHMPHEFSTKQRYRNRQSPVGLGPNSGQIQRQQLSTIEPRESYLDFEQETSKRPATHEKQRGGTIQHGSGTIQDTVIKRPTALSIAPRVIEIRDEEQEQQQIVNHMDQQRQQSKGSQGTGYVSELRMFSENFAKSTHKKGDCSPSSVRPARKRPNNSSQSKRSASNNKKRLAITQIVEQNVVQCLPGLLKNYEHDGGHENPLISLIHQSLARLRMPSQPSLSFFANSHLLNLTDNALRTDAQLCSFLTVLQAVLENVQSLKLTDTHHQSLLQLKGLNFNNNHQLGDASVRAITQFAKSMQDVKVVSIEKFHASFTAIASLMKSLPETKIVELNISGIPLSYFCIEQLCETLSSHRQQITLRVLHVRNCKLTDASALKLMEHVILGGPMDDNSKKKPLKLKYLSMRMNSQLGFRFQSELVKMMKESLDLRLQQPSECSAERSRRKIYPFHLKYLDVQFCNVSQQNLTNIEKYLQENQETQAAVSHEKRKHRSTSNKVRASQHQYQAHFKVPMVQYEGTSPSQIDKKAYNQIAVGSGNNDNLMVPKNKMMQIPTEEEHEIMVRQIRSDQERKNFQTEGPSIKKRRSQSIYSEVADDMVAPLADMHIMDEDHQGHMKYCPEPIESAKELVAAGLTRHGLNANEAADTFDIHDKETMDDMLGQHHALIVDELPQQVEENYQEEHVAYNDSAMVCEDQAMLDQTFQNLALTQAKRSQQHEVLNRQMNINFQNGQMQQVSNSLNNSGSHSCPNIMPMGQMRYRDNSKDIMQQDYLEIDEMKPYSQQMNHIDSSIMQAPEHRMSNDQLGCLLAQSQSSIQYENICRKQQQLLESATQGNISAGGIDINHSMQNLLLETLQKMQESSQQEALLIELQRLAASAGSDLALQQDDRARIPHPYLDEQRPQIDNRQFQTVQVANCANNSMLEPTLNQNDSSQQQNFGSIYSSNAMGMVNTSTASQHFDQSMMHNGIYVNSMPTSVQRYVEPMVTSQKQKQIGPLTRLVENYKNRQGSYKSISPMHGSAISRRRPSSNNSISDKQQQKRKRSVPSMNKEREKNRRRISEFFSHQHGSRSVNQLPGFTRATYSSIERTRLRARSAASQQCASRYNYSRSPMAISASQTRQIAGKRFSMPTARASDKADKCTFLREQALRRLQKRQNSSKGCSFALLNRQRLGSKRQSQAMSVQQKYLQQQSGLTRKLSSKQMPSQRFRDNIMVRDIDLDNRYLRASRQHNNVANVVQPDSAMQHQRQPTQETSFFQHDGSGLEPGCNNDLGSIDISCHGGQGSSAGLDQSLEMHAQNCSSLVINPIDTEQSRALKYNLKGIYNGQPTDFAPMAQHQALPPKDLQQNANSLNAKKSSVASHGSVQTTMPQSTSNTARARARPQRGLGTRPSTQMDQVSSNGVNLSLVDLMNLQRKRQQGFGSQKHSKVRPPQQQPLNRIGTSRPTAPTDSHQQRLLASSRQGGWRAGNEENISATANGQRARYVDPQCVQTHRSVINKTVRDKNGIKEHQPTVHTSYQQQYLMRKEQAMSNSSNRASRVTSRTRQNNYEEAATPATVAAMNINTSSPMLVHQSYSMADLRRGNQRNTNQYSKLTKNSNNESSSDLLNRQSRLCDGNTKSCSSISQSQVSRGRRYDESEVTGIRDMIKDEIDRLQQLYMKIEKVYGQQD